MEERRRYFRLDDEVVMDFQAISQEEFQHWKESQSLEKNELRELEQELGTLLHQMRSVHPSLAQILELYNRKINLLSGHKDDSSGAPMSGTESRVRVNLSACGMSFYTDSDLSGSSHLLFQLQLKPSNAMLNLAGTVVSAEKTQQTNNPFLVRVNFDGIQESEQELLIQHLFQLQSKTLKHMRDH
ncbi:MAG: hypothetical protein CMI08_14730 [Oceanospirillaceae bacterium]|uniref:PilZ domain-containing protein n=1 Tax=unclassified Thalassolituus TaxID=2624967 RepID=UPI000C5E8BA7|nr:MULTISPECIES: PilZ domain-containing protein [unclassified Thalassolituus]MAS26143.1 hypothetical protein [Oceanospirillaceae bacterium]MAY00422.1 hypothetical protein [Oceanospirillaceae bacterium]MBL34032.1 hypothetical protein [Oceanospirillaceae bacterium]MBS52036.1 hypothetical protein [Oceanospirillaceae bacterium]|tara:strand:- start:3199 stop:3753 length:555 start_codon:yes stop_codon:yes gene_type:complete